MRVALYTRVSTRDKGQDVTNQVTKLKALCANHGWEVVHDYQDLDSGSRAERPQFNQMLKDAAQGEFKLLLFWALDRFSREGTLATLKHLELLEHYGVSWKSLTEPWIDSAGPFRDVVISLLASLAKQEKLRISERVRAGLDRARNGGTKTGRPIGRPKVVLNKDRVVEYRSKGMSWRQIAQKLGTSATSVRRACEVLSTR